MPVPGGIRRDLRSHPNSRPNLDVPCQYHSAGPETFAASTHAVLGAKPPVAALRCDCSYGAWVPLALTYPGIFVTLSMSVPAPQSFWRVIGNVGLKASRQISLSPLTQ